MSILDHPELQIEPETKRETLLYIKAYLTAVDTTLSGVEEFGLPAAKETHARFVADVTAEIEAELQTHVVSSEAPKITEQFAEANPDEVKHLLDHLVNAFEEYCSTSPEEVEYLDAFMAVHNFHVVILLDIERRLKANPERQLFLRKLAMDTFRQAMENKPAFKQERE